MGLRGATQDEVENTIRSAPWENTKCQRYHARLPFTFGEISAINQIFYDYKTIDAIFVEEPDQIVVITVKVYYHN